MLCKHEIAAFKVHAGVVQERWTNLILQMIQIALSITLECATEFVAGVVGQRIVRKCADLDTCRTVLGWKVFILGTKSIIKFEESFS